MKIAVLLTLAMACVARGDGLATQPVVAKPAIVSAAEWGSAPQPIPDSRKHTPKYITIHHAGTIWKPGGDPLKVVKGLQVYGQKEKNWPDVPYHFIIAPDGRIIQGRSMQYEPESNTKYNLQGHIGVELLGNFEEQRVNLPQLESVTKLVAWLCQDLKIDPSEIATHRDRAKDQTVCPGKDFYRYFSDGEFQKWVRETLAGKPPEIELRDPLPDGPTVMIGEPLPVDGGGGAK
jgi:hypothetical protein